MLNASSPAQKSLNEEDGSGSDAGSEVSLEPETDRFGFILTNGSTAGSVGPAPELVRQRETKWISIILQGDRMMFKKTSKVKEQCQKGIPASLRAKGWPLLCAATDRMKQNEKLYELLDSQPALQSWVDVIERDLGRQFPFHEMFLCKDGHGQRGLFRVLKAFTQYQPEEGYCQAQGPVAAVLLMNMPAEEAFWCLVQISEQYLPGYYSPLLEGVLFDAGMLTWVLRRTCPAAQKHLQRHEVEPLMFATDWLMCLFTRHLPFNTLLRVWDLFFCYGVRVLLQVAVVLIRRVLGHAKQRGQCQGQMETLERLRGVREQVHDEADAFVAEVCAVPLSARDLEKQTEKELEKWRKDRPSSTFDPRGRCLGYQMAWTMARQHQEDRDRKERQKGNLSFPLSRSASSLSLSFSPRHQNFSKGEVVGERKGGCKVVRHVSLGAKEDVRSRSDFSFKKVQIVQEEEDECKELSEVGRIGGSHEKELLEKPNEIHREETEEKERAETEDGQGEREEPNQTAENILQLSEHLAHCTPEEQLSSLSQSQEAEVKDVTEETEEEEVSESEHSSAVEENLRETQTVIADVCTQMEVHADLNEEQMIPSDMQPEEGTENDKQQQVVTVAQVSETRTETMPGSETESREEVITDACGAKCHSTEEVKEEIKESDPQTEKESEEVMEENAATENEAELTDSTTEETEDKGKTFILTSPEQQQQDEDKAADEKTEEVTAIRENRELSEAQSSEKESDEEPTREKDKTILTVLSEAQDDAEKCHNTEEVKEEIKESDSQTEKEGEEVMEENAATEDQSENEAEETFILTSPERLQQQQDEDVAADQKSEAENTEFRSERDEVAFETTHETMSTEAQAEEDQSETHSVTSTVEEETPQQDEAVTDGKPTSQVTAGPSEEEVFTPTLTDSQRRDKNDVLTQAPGRRSSRSSGDFCVRKSSTYHESRLARKLSTDLFTAPQKTTEPTESQPKPRAANTTRTSADGTQSSKAASSSMAKEQEPPAATKRLNFFRRLRGQHSKKSKEKSARKMQVPKILIQDFSDETGTVVPVPEDGEEKLTSRERRKIRREQERRDKEDERARKKREKEKERERRDKEDERARKKREKEKERERRKPQTRSKSFQVQKEKGRNDPSSQTLHYSSSYHETYF